MPLCGCVYVGSSPLTRGAHLSGGHGRHDVRLIPAHAGSTVQAPVGAFNTGAHPRSRGEHVGAPRVSRVHRGSSPLTRGALGLIPSYKATVRLIPAHAGSTVSQSDAYPDTPAHPRSRGEHDPRIVNAITVVRLIPAHAGSTTPGGEDYKPKQAHPRSRGEHYLM